MSDDSFENDRMDERLRQLAAAHYNPPRGPVPRDEMWATIAAARRAERAASVPATIVPIAGRRRAARWGWAAGLAAALIAGVVIDRLVVNRSNVIEVATTPVRAPSHSASTPRPTPPDTTAAPTVPTRQLATRTRSETSTDPRPSDARVPRAPRPRLAEPSPNAPTRVAQAPTSTDQPATDPRGLYQAAARQTLLQADALLTSYRRAESEPRDAETMRQTARWSRDVLSSTRLLLDSPAGRDPQLRQLLTDLELVLAQIVQVSGAPLQADERELIERALRERDLLPRIRSAVPAGVTAS